MSERRPSERQSGLVATLANMPRVMKWALLAGAVLVVYFVAIEPALDFAASVRDKGDRIERNLARDAALSDPTSDDGRLIALAREHFGAARAPGDAGLTPEGLYRLVDRVLKEHGVEDASINERTAQLRSEHLDAATGSVGGGVNRFILEVTFDSDAETAMDVLAALEQSPEVSAVGRVRLDTQQTRTGSGGDERNDARRYGGLVHATIAPEIWLTADPAEGGGS